MVDDAAADPASLGVAILLASATQPAGKAQTYTVAANRELDYLMTKVPRIGGAISHRAHEEQFWSDSVVSLSTLLVASRSMLKLLRSPWSLPSWPTPAL